jgi:uncharacterized protein YjbI with pentapeptide repeats
LFQKDSKREDSLGLNQAMSEAVDNVQSTVISGEELKVRYQAGERDFSSCELSGVVLSGANLSDVILDGANLSYAILRGANLSHAQLRKANLDGADLYEAILDEATLKEANLEGALLDGASAQGANFRHAGLRDAHLSAVKMQNADLRGADLRRVNLLKANLCQARLEQAYLVGAFFEEADLTNARLEGANISGANFRGAKLDAAWVAGVKFDKRTLFWRTSLEQMSGDPVFSRFARDQAYIETFRVRHPAAWALWAISSDCGRSMARWLVSSLALMIFFGLLFSVLHDDLLITVKDREVTWFTYFYYSIVTFTTLGFGDVVPRTTLGEVLVSFEVFSGYLMLGGLVSIFANKLARRS